MEWPWYNWLLLGGAVVLGIGYKMYRDKTMR